MCINYVVFAEINGKVRKVYGMDIALGIWSAGLFFLAGLTIGKIKWGRFEVEEDVADEEGRDQWRTQESLVAQRDQESQGSARTHGRLSFLGQQGVLRSKGQGDKKAVPGEKRIPLGWAVGSPVSGAVTYFHEGTKRGAKIVPEQGVLYAPAAGKITRLYPTGNAMRLRTDYGIELLIQAGVDTEELEGRHYRARILKNEVVNKGKPLLEFDVEAIRDEGYDPSVVMTVEDAQDFQDVTVCDAPRVKAGENLLWVRR